MSDLSILTFFIVFFLLLGGALPFIQAELNEPSTSADVEGLSDSFNEDPGTVSVSEVFGSIFSMFFWTFGSIPFIIDLALFIPLRIIMVVLGIRMLRGQG